jgi:hypothetical protein
MRRSLRARAERPGRFAPDRTSKVARRVVTRVDRQPFMIVGDTVVANSAIRDPESGSAWYFRTPTLSSGSTRSRASTTIASTSFAAPRADARIFVAVAVPSVNVAGTAPDIRRSGRSCHPRSRTPHHRAAGDTARPGARVVSPRTPAPPSSIAFYIGKRKDADRHAIPFGRHDDIGRPTGDLDPIEPGRRCSSDAAASLRHDQCAPPDRIRTPRCVTLSVPSTRLRADRRC